MNTSITIAAICLLLPAIAWAGEQAAQPAAYPSAVSGKVFLDAD